MINSLTAMNEEAPSDFEKEIVGQLEANFLDGESIQSNPTMFTVAGVLDIAEYFFQAGKSSTTIAKIREEFSKLSWGPYDPISILDEVENEKN